MTAPRAIYELSELFHRVQMNAILPDGKTFVDCIPRFTLEEIEDRYESEKDRSSFDLLRFVQANFDMPEAQGAGYEGDPVAGAAIHIQALWDILTRQPAEEKGSLLALPFPYIVPGGRFREIYYWDSYFTMLGLIGHGRVALVENMVDNFAYLITTYGHIPNGNRVYYLSRSQPPFFALMVELLASAMNSDSIYLKYADALEREYLYWQQGIESIAPGTAVQKVVALPGGEYLSRYFDTATEPRYESYAEDIHLAGKSSQPPAALYANIRAAAESGWDFSSRWFADGGDISNSITTHIIPVDLNCLLYELELVLAKTKRLRGDNPGAASLEAKAVTRKAAIHKYCWNEAGGYFCDYDFITQTQRPVLTAATVVPLFTRMAADAQAASIAKVVEQSLLKPGGMVTTTRNTGEQWDAPNGWAPLQWMAVTGLRNYGHYALANTIAERWLALNEKVFAATGKMMEKYNVEDMTQLAGGGEYPGQDGFGWTNGVYIALKQ
jgi:alpha,alpha-trehalase